MKILVPAALSCADERERGVLLGNHALDGIHDVKKSHIGHPIPTPVPGPMSAARRRLYLLPLALSLMLVGAGARRAWRGWEREDAQPRAHVDHFAVATENAAAT